MVSKSDIISWILGVFAVNGQSGDEYRFDCPKCSHSAFYFNVAKKIGFCHRASCHSKLSLSDLEYIVGHSVGSAGYVPSVHNKKEQVLPSKVQLPKCWKAEDDSFVMHALEERGVFDRSKIFCDSNSIIVPVTYEGELVQYVRRFIDRNKEPKECFNTPHKLRYDYFKGSHITDFLLNWDQHKVHSKRITLVENTFNALCYDTVTSPFTTNFGSYLSDSQVDLIKHSRIRTVVILWDEGANTSAAVKKLKKAGVRACALTITGQPDDHKRQHIISVSNICHKSLLIDGSFNGVHKPLNEQGWYQDR